MRRVNGHYNVAPRYTPGSPAQVPEDIALKVAEEEKHFIEHALEGAWGAEQKARAEKLGLRGIVEMRVEKGSGKKAGWEVTDLCTGERFFRLSTEALRKHGFDRFNALDSWAQQEVRRNPPALERYEDNGWFKADPGKYVVTLYEPERIRSDAP